MKSSSKPKITGWLALGTVALGILLTAIGLSMLSWRPRTQSASVAADEPTSTRIVAVLPTLAPPTATPTPLPATPTLTKPPTVSPTAAPTQTPKVPAASKSFEIAIIHSNDTWGYTQPCG